MEARQADDSEKLVGTMIGRYHVLQKIGEGGMGKVYEALDTKLNRKVALKSLPPQFTQDLDCGSRFQRESNALAALNHPNIVAIYDTVEQDARSFIVMEYVDGTPLSELIPKRGMKLSDALRMAVQIADAVAAAHATGIVHRDLKPSNVMLDRQGRVKVLDFGLAKLVGMPTLAQSADTLLVTSEGMIVGSVPYMSPEQAEGRTVDARSDIFSFGAVLYEMVTGQRAFPGESRASTLVAVLHNNPKPPSNISEATPPEVERLIVRCLRKDVNRRSQHMSDVKLALEELRDESESGKLIKPVYVTATRHSKWQWFWFAAVFPLVVAIAIAWMYQSRAARRFRAPELVRLSPDDGYSYSAPAISPDGKLVAYVSDRSGKPELWLQQVGGSQPIQLTHSRNGVVRAAFFPEGTRILYLTSSATPEGKDTLEIISTLGGESQVLVSGTLPHTAAKFPSFGISPDGHQIAYIEAQQTRGPNLVVIAAAGGEPRTLVGWRDIQLRGVFAPLVQWTADGRSLLCVGMKTADARNMDDWDWFLIPVSGGQPVSTGDGASLRTAGFGFTFPTANSHNRWFFVGPGVLQGHVWQIDLLPANGRIDGNRQQLTFGTEDESATSVSDSGMAAIQSARLYSDLYFISLDRATGNPLGATRRLTQDTRDKMIADQTGLGDGGDPELAYFSEAAQTSSGYNLRGYSLNLETGRQIPLNTLPSLGDKWIVSRDGRQIAYSLPDGDRFSIRISEGSGSLDSARPLCRDCGLASAFSPDGRYVLYDPGRPVRRDPERKAGIHLLDVISGKDKVWLEDATDSIELRGFMGQKGEWAAVSLRAPKAPATSAQNFLVPWREEPVPRREWIEVPAKDPRFSAASDFVYFFSGTQFEAVKFDPKLKRFGASFEVNVIPGSQLVPKPDDSWTVRGSSIVFARQDTKSSVWLMKIPD